MNPAPIERFRPSSAAILGAHAALFAGLTWWSWSKWPDPVIDFGRELYLPWQIVNGKVLFRDVESLFGPLSPYVNALWFRLFGVSLLTLVVVNLALFAAMLAGIHRIVRLSADRFTAAAASLVTLTLFGFLQLGDVGNYNFATPYAHEATHGLALGIGLVVALHAALTGGRWVAITIAGLAFGSLLLTKPETSVAAAGAAGVAFLGFGALGKPERHRLLVAVPLFAGAAAIPPLLFFVYFLRHMDAAAALGAIARGWTTAFQTTIATNIFYVRGMGLDRPGANAVSMMLMFAAFVVYVAAAVAISWPGGRSSLPPVARRIGRLAVVAVAPLAMWVGFARALPVIVLGAAAIAGRAFVRTRHDREAAMRWLMLAVWCTFALVLLAKLGLNARIHHYGFYLALPATTVVVMILCWLVPHHLEVFGRSDAAVHFRRLATAVLVVALAPWLAAADMAYRPKTVPVGAGPDRFLAADGYWHGRAMRDALLRLESIRRDGDKLAVLPEGVMLNYLARLESPLRVINLMPPELHAFGEDEILRALRADPPRFVILVTRDTSEYGYPLFGTQPQYGARTQAWVGAHYGAIATFAEDVPGGLGHGLELLECKCPRPLPCPDQQ